MNYIRAVAFDVDGTLYPNSRMYLASLGFAMRNMSLLRRFQKVRRQMRDIRPIEDFYALQAQMLARELKKDHVQTRQIIDREFYGSWESVLDHVALYPGVIELLAGLRDRSVPLGVLSDFPVERKLKKLSVSQYFDVALGSESVGYLKPAAEPFETLVRELGIQPHQLLYVGNSYEYDICGAADLGIQTAHLTRKPVKNSRADFSFANYQQLGNWLFPRLLP